MKAKIHPEFNKVTVSCACGSSFETCSTAKELKVEVCSACHPFFTGTQRFVDTAGRVERFKQKIEQHQKVADERAAREKAKPQPRVAKGSKAAEKTEKAETPTETPAAE